jgi:hypothetical protein
MALRLVRQTSDTPNITNKDDTIMTRYAYGGYNGIVKGFGNECGYTAENGIFKVLDGRIVIDGWEIDIDGVGWNLNLSTVTGTQYHSVYAEINVATESVKLDSTYLTGFYPEIDKGDDLTEIPNGTARILLYNVKVENGVITETVKKFEIILYLTQKVLDVEKRLDELGFKQGEFQTYGASPEKINIYKEGNLVCGEIVFNREGGFPSFYIGTFNSEEWVLGAITTPILLPKSKKIAYCETRIDEIYLKQPTSEASAEIQLHATASIDTDGFLKFKVDSYINDFFDSVSGIKVAIVKVGFWYRLDDKE